MVERQSVGVGVRILRTERNHPLDAPAIRTPTAEGETMSKVTIASQQQQIAELQSHADSLRKRMGESEDDAIKMRHRNQRLAELARIERRECEFLRRRMGEVNESLVKIRQRINFAIDCVGGRSGGELVPMGAKLYVTVEAILARAIDIPTSNAECESNLRNMAAHKHIRDMLPNIDALDMDAT
jgi:prefoldin subunit 5